MHDHHIHLLSLAAALNSVHCGPPDTQSAEQLATALRSLNDKGNPAWVRGIGYHPCVAGDIDRHWLDRFIPDRPVRIQHRGGRLWVLNSRALAQLGIPGGEQPPGVEMDRGMATGRLFECDHWLRKILKSRFPDLTEVSNRLAGYGITGVTDTTPSNGMAEWQFFHQSQVKGLLKQRVRMMGSHQILECGETDLLIQGEYKVHLLESQLPDLDGLQENIAKAHHHGRAVAIHCVTVTELVFAIAALRTAGIRNGDRIEHASVTPPDMLDAIAELGLRVITQPHFIAERGDQYCSDVDPREQPWLYRCASFMDAGIPLAGGSDAPFGAPDPWRAMQAAIDRKTSAGEIMNAGEALTPEQALSLYLSDLPTPGIEPRRIRTGVSADICLLDSPWETVRKSLNGNHVRCTWRSGELIYKR